MSERYEAHRAKTPDLTYSRLVDELKITTPKEGRLPFDPAKARYYDLVASGLLMTDAEKALFRAEGVTNVDHSRQYSMASAYHAIYTRDLPVLVTSDSILHALHRSFDDVLIDLEEGLFTHAIADVLEGAHSALESSKSKLCCELADTAADADLYLTVARNLLQGEGAVPPGPNLPVSPRLGNDQAVRDMLARIASLEFQHPAKGVSTPVYGGRRFVDYSQFAPRGHYTRSEGLKRYFRTLMWLGRADLGFTLAPPDPRSGQSADAGRELRAAATITWLVGKAGKVRSLQAVNSAVEFLVGRSDNLTLPGMARALDRAGLKDPVRLLDGRTLAAVQASLAKESGQQIRSQIIVSPSEDPKEVPPPKIFQLFGQRFVVDSFVLSKVVYDSIVFQKAKVERHMPSGLDVMAALGNDHAVPLLKDELEQYRYSTNLLALRRTVDETPTGEWEESAYNRWLDALRTLDDPPAGGHFPTVMRRTAWQRKQLQTQLASWAELRHDTILYAKQSYGAVAICEYPEGYVEPYPAFFARVAGLTSELARRLGSLQIPDGLREAQRLKGARDRQKGFFEGFAKTTRRLEGLARKELAAIPFTAEEAMFLKQTVDIRGGGSGPPEYDGWYPRLIYGGKPTKWDPSVADVHTNANDGVVLEVAVGNVNFIVVAVDNQSDRAAYVGPVYSYYELAQPVSQRMTDEQWRERLEKENAPPRPPWTAPFRPPAAPRDLGRPEGRRP